MDTAAYLTSQGWLGSGHSLDPSGHGIVKPLLISKKPDLLGLGKRKADVHADQWWARDFDTTLRNLNIGTGGATEMPEKVLLKTGLQPLGRTVQDSPKWGLGGLGNGLYGHFVQGEGLSGTHTPEVVDQVNTYSCQNLQARENEDKSSSRFKRRRHKNSKKEPMTRKSPFSRPTEPEIYVCGQETSKNNPRVAKRELHMGRGGESQLNSKPAIVNTKKESHKAEVAPKTACKRKISRKMRHRHRIRRIQKMSSSFD